MNRFFAMAAVFFPLAALALTPMQEKDMQDTSGQAGVSIVLDVYAALHLETDAWGGPEAGKTGRAAGWIGAGDLAAAPAREEEAVNPETDADSYRMLITYGGSQGGHLPRDLVPGVTLALEALLGDIHTRPQAWGDPDDGGSSHSDTPGGRGGHLTGALNLDGLNVDGLDLLAKLGLNGIARLNQTGIYIDQMTSSVSTLYLTGRDVFGGLAAILAASLGSLSDTGFVFTLEGFENAPVAAYSTMETIFSDMDPGGNIRPGMLKATSTIGTGAPQTRQPVLGEIYMGGTSAVVDGKVSVTETRP
ncbi:MAG: hypothetical protein HUN04_25080 [Desulfobacter sp.]|nr:MAG: hypothetical protein HUN04_25080 [Desulfobacter sp.]